MIEVSILIPCYNVERWVRQAVDSAISQTYSRCEVICVDDGSTYGTLDILLSYGSQIRLETGPNRGGNVTRNRLLSLSRGSWVQYLDADDYLESDKISRHVQSLTQDASADVLYGEVTIEQTDAQGSLQTDVETIPGTDDVCRLLIEWSIPQTGGAFWKKEALLRAVPPGCANAISASLAPETPASHPGESNDRKPGAVRLASRYRFPGSFPDRVCDAWRSSDRTDSRRRFRFQVFGLRRRPGRRVRPVSKGWGCSRQTACL